MPKVRKHRRRHRLLLFTVILISGVLLFFEWRLKPISASIAEIQAQALATELINRSVSEIFDEMELSSDALETITFSEDNTVASVHADAVLANTVKNAVTLRIQDHLSQIQNRQVNIPIGTIIGGEITNGAGPSVPIYISLSGNVRSDFESTFESGGIDQTVHRLSLRIVAEINIIMPLHAVSTTVETTVLIGETVIVGSGHGSQLRVIKDSA